MITGYSNREVAEALLSRGLQGMDGCVYIDDNGHQVVLMRSHASTSATPSLDGTTTHSAFIGPVPLRQCGLPPHRRFTFYDQIHATGTDIKQAVAAVAAVTVNKDMTLRDCTSLMALSSSVPCSEFWLLALLTTHPVHSRCSRVLAHAWTCRGTVLPCLHR